MHDLMPKNPIPREQLNNWDFYSSGIENQPYLKKYFENTFRKWVIEKDNPLIITWIQDLFLSRLGYLDKILEELEEYLGKENLTNLLQEIIIQGGDSVAINQKLYSIQSEIHTFRQLDKDKHKNIKKIESLGDWESDQAIVSVKSITNLNYNYELIEDIIRALHFVKENSILREYNLIRLLNQTGMDYTFLNQLYSFLKNSLIENLKQVANLKPQTRNYFKLVQQNIDREGQLKSNFHIGLFVEKNAADHTATFWTHEDRIDSTTKKKHEITLKFINTITEPKSIFAVSYDSHTFRSGNAINLKNQIKSKLTLFDKAVTNKHCDKPFIGWINIPVSPNHQKYVENNLDQIKNTYSPLIKGKKYNVILCFIPQFKFEMKNTACINL